MDLTLEFMRFVEDQPDQSTDLLLDKVLLKSRRLLGAEAGSLFLIEEQDDGTLHVRPMCLQNDVIDVSNVALELAVDNNSLVGYVAATGQTIFVADAYAADMDEPYRFNHAIDDLSGYRTVSVLAFPLKTFSESVIGVVQLINRRVPGAPTPVPFQAAQADLIRPVNQLIGRAIQRTLLLDQLRAANAALTATNQMLMAEMSGHQRTEQALEAALDAAEDANIAKSNFLANMSHELRTPLNSILGFAQLIAGQHVGPVGGRYVEYANDIIASGSHLKSIIDDILDLAKIEAGKATLRDDCMELTSVVADALRIMRPQAEAAGLTLHVAATAGVTQLVADERMVRQIVINLLSNAVKFTPRGGRIEIDAGVDLDGGGYVSVSDTGIGMAADKIPVALSPFGQVANVYTRRTGGTGLGLPLVKSIAELHGGRLDIASAPGNGTKVTVRFPPERTPRAA